MGYSGKLEAADLGGRAVEWVDSGRIAVVGRSKSAERTSGEAVKGRSVVAERGKSSSQQVVMGSWVLVVTGRSQQHGERS